MTPQQLMTRVVLDAMAQVDDTQFTLADLRRELAHHGLDETRIYERPMHVWGPGEPAELCRELHERRDHDGGEATCDCAEELAAERCLNWRAAIYGMLED